MKKALFEELLESVKQAKAMEKGELKPARVFRINPRADIVRVRGKLGLSQLKFAAILGISADTLQDWEQGRRSPTGPAKVLLKIAAKHPEVLLDHLSSFANASSTSISHRTPSGRVLTD